MSARFSIELERDAIRPFESQAREYPERGAPGITHGTVRLRAADVGTAGDVELDTLTLRDKHGILRGILVHHRAAIDTIGGVHLADAHEIQVTVDPRFRRKGIATRLLREALSRWPIQLFAQHCTADGAQLLATVNRRFGLAAEQRSENRDLQRRARG